MMRDATFATPPLYHAAVCCMPFAVYMPMVLMRRRLMAYALIRHFMPLTPCRYDYACLLRLRRHDAAISRYHERAIYFDAPDAISRRRRH